VIKYFNKAQSVRIHFFTLYAINLIFYDVEDEILHNYFVIYKYSINKKKVLEILLNFIE